MNETPRVAALVSELAPCASLADVGCDHGYCTLAALERGLCARAVVTDISARSLQKAERLLAPYIAQGRVQSVCCDGLAGVPADTEQVLIAGMGGEEIVTILTRGFLPPRLVLQPMKNAPKVRRFLVEAGYRLEHDYTLFVGRKYYDIVRAARGENRGYSPLDLRFGYDNLKSPSPAFARWLEGEREACRARMAQAKSSPALEGRLAMLSEACDETLRNLR